MDNKASEDLDVYVYDMGLCWQVQNIYGGSYEVIPPRNSGPGFTFKKKLRIIVPLRMREKGHRQCQDIIKVFVTFKSTSFDLLELPKLDKSAKRNTTDWISQKDSDTLKEWAALNFSIRMSLK